MKRLVSTATTLMIAFMAMLFASANLAAAGPPQTLTKKELKTLLKNAATPADHLKIASYYRAEAEKLSAISREHANEAIEYAKTTPFPAMESKHGIAFGASATHCRYWATQNAEAARKATAQAALHEEMAKKAVTVATLN